MVLGLAHRQGFGALAQNGLLKEATMAKNELTPEEEDIRQ